MLRKWLCGRLRGPAIAYIALVAVVGLSGCYYGQQYKDRDVVENQQAIYSRKQPIPKFDWSQDRAVLIQIYQAKNEARNTWSVWYSAMGTPLDSCPSIGYPLPADSQLTNPVALMQGSSSVVVEQPEPNGIFSSKNTHATYVLCVRANGDIAPVHVEPDVVTYPYPVHIENSQIVRDAGGDSTIKLDLQPR